MNETSRPARIQPTLTTPKKEGLNVGMSFWPMQPTGHYEVFFVPAGRAKVGDKTLAQGYYYWTPNKDLKGPYETGPDAMAQVPKGIQKRLYGYEDCAHDLAGSSDGDREAGS